MYFDFAAGLRRCALRIALVLYSAVKAAIV